jgi:hypothetical protein
LQFFHDADDVDAYLLDTMRVVSTDDVGHDEQSVQALLKKHDGVSEELERFDRHIAQLEAQAQQLPEEVCAEGRKEYTHAMHIHHDFLLFCRPAFCRTFNSG